MLRMGIEPTTLQPGISEAIPDQRTHRFWISGRPNLARLADQAREGNAANDKALLPRAHCVSDRAAGTPRAHCARSDIDQLTGRASMPA